VNREQLVTESTPDEAIEPIAQASDESGHAIDLVSGEVTPVGDSVDVGADNSGHSFESAVNDPETIPETVSESVTETETIEILPEDTAGSPPVEPVPAIEETESVAGTENEAVKDTGAAGGTVAKDVTPKQDQKPNRKLGWRAYILGGSGGTK
jgi:hypothetical protein